MGFTYLPKLNHQYKSAYQAASQQIVEFIWFIGVEKIIEFYNVIYQPSYKLSTSQVTHMTPRAKRKRHGGLGQNIVSLRERFKAVTISIQMCWTTYKKKMV